MLVSSFFDLIHIVQTNLLPDDIGKYVVRDAEEVTRLG